MMKKLVCVLAIIGSLVSGCATPSLTGNITASWDDIGALKGKTVYVTAVPDILNKTADFPAYRQIIETHLVSQGFVISEDPAHADILAAVSYGGVGDYKKQEEHVAPIIAQTAPGRTTYYNGTVNTVNGPVTYSGSSYTAPSYGIVGYSQYTTTEHRYPHFLDITLHDGTGPDAMTKKPLHFAKLTVSGDCKEIDQLFPKMADALFARWTEVNVQPFPISTSDLKCNQ